MILKITASAFEAGDFLIIFLSFWGFRCSFFLIKKPKVVFDYFLLVVSSNINEGIKAVIFFKRKDFTHSKSTTTHISEQKQKKQF